MHLHRRGFLGVLAAVVISRRLPPSPVFSGMDLASGPDSTAIVITGNFPGGPVDAAESYFQHILRPLLTGAKGRLREGLTLEDCARLYDVDVAYVALPNGRR